MVHDEAQSETLCTVFNKGFMTVCSYGMSVQSLSQTCLVHFYSDKFTKFFTDIL